MSGSATQPQLLATDGTLRSMAVLVTDFDDAPDFWRCQGWARYARKILATATGQDQATDTGPLLFAEWIDNDGRSCRIAPHPSQPGKRQQIIFPQDDGQWEREQVTIVGRGALSDQMLHYDVYWTDDGDGAVRRAIDVFRGLTPATRGQS